MWAGAGLLAVALLVPASGAAKTVQDRSQDAIHTTQWALLAALATLVLPSILAWFVSASFRRLVVGADNQLSTSKTMMTGWSYLVAAGLLGFVYAKFVGKGAALDAIEHSGLAGQYAVLIGGPIGAAILAKGIKVSQVQSGDAPPPAEAADRNEKPKGKLSHLVTNEAGDTDPGDLQYVLFNAVAMIFFVGMLVHAPLSGFPHIPDVLLGLTSVSAIGYVGKKGLPVLGGGSDTRKRAN
jgi:hypothetical protein